MQYKSMNELIDERFDDIYPLDQDHHSGITLKSLDIQNNDNCCTDLNSDVFFFKEDIEDDGDLIQPVSTITHKKATNIYIPVITPIMEEDETESEEDEEVNEKTYFEAKSTINSVEDYNLDLIRYHKDLVLKTIKSDIESLYSTLPSTYKQCIQVVKTKNLLVL